MSEDDQARLQAQTEALLALQQTNPAALPSAMGHPPQGVPAGGPNQPPGFGVPPGVPPPHMEGGFGHPPPFHQPPPFGSHQGHGPHPPHPQGGHGGPPPPHHNQQEMWGNNGYNSHRGGHNRGYNNDRRGNW